MDEDNPDFYEEKPCAAKLSRKIGEKLRRDRLNSLITQLAEEIPIIKYAHKRLDKSAILRLTVSYMELHQGLKKKPICNKGNVSGYGLLDWLKKMTDDALMIINQLGTILYISPKITDHIGFYQTDMLGHNIDQFIHRNDLKPFMSLFSSDSRDPSAASYATFKPGHSNNGFSQLENLHDENSLYIRLLKATRRKRTASDTREYETFNIQCRCEKSNNSSSIGVNSGQRWMVSILRPMSKEPVREIEVQISEFIKNNEWASMHSLDGKILAQDHRCALFLGRMPSESIGKSPYGLIHKDDLEMIAISHRDIMKDKETCTVFRMNTALKSILYIQSQSILVKESWTKAPKCIVSVNTVLDMEKGMHLLDLQKETTAKILEDSECSSDNKVVEETIDNANNGKNNNSENCDKLSLNDGDCKKELILMYEEKAKVFPDLYASQKNCSENTSHFPASEKRSIDCVDSDISGSESNASRLSDSSRCEHDEDKKSPSIPENPVLIGLLNSKKRLMTKQDPCNNNNKGSSESLPLLKGILEGRVKMEKSSYQCVPWKRKPSDTSLITESDSDLSDKLSCDEKVNFGHSKEPEFHSQGYDDIGSSSSGNYSTFCIGSEASSLGVQSPTIGSSEAEADSSATLVCNRFTKQLELKHAMLKRTLSSQRNTLDILREQIQKSHNNILLQNEEKNIHDALLERLVEAETQVEAQGRLLGELEAEILTQRHKVVNT